MAVLDRQFVFVVGKGGVGKTVVTAALAMAAQKRGKRVLVALANARDNFSRFLEVPPLDHQIREVLPGIDAVNMHPAHALSEYGLMVLKVRAVHQAIFGNRLVTAFLRGTPGIDAWSMLGKAYYHATEGHDHGRRRYDMVILDAPATGHALDMLRVPTVIVKVAPPGLLRREAERALELFRDPARTATVLVTLPEDMPTNETVELARTLEDELGMPATALVVNQRADPTIPEALEDAVIRLAETLPSESPAQPYAVAARRRARRQALERSCIERLRRAIPLDPVDLPYVLAQEMRREHIESLASTLDAPFGR